LTGPAQSVYVQRRKAVYTCASFIEQSSVDGVYKSLIIPTARVT